MKLFIGHPLSRRSPVTYFKQDYAAAVTTIKVKNSDGFSTSKYVVLGQPGLEQAEIVRPTTVTSPDTFVVTPATKFSHNADQKVTLLDYNQIKVYRSTTGISGVYNLMTTLDIQIDADVTPYEDTTAFSSYYYKFSYYNAQAAQESDQSDAIAATGYTFYSLKTMVDRVLSLFGDSKAEFATREEVTDYLNEPYEKDQQNLAVSTKRFSVNTQIITVDTTHDEYDLNADFLMEIGISKSTDGGNTWGRNIVMQQLDSLGNVLFTNEGEGYVIYNNKLKLKTYPTNNTDKYKIYYVTAPVTMINQTDTLIAPFTHSSATYVKYALGMLYLKDKKFDEYRALMAEAEQRSVAHLSFIKKLSNKHPQYMERTGEIG